MNVPEALVVIRQPDDTVVVSGMAQGKLVPMETHLTADAARASAAEKLGIDADKVIVRQAEVQPKEKRT